MPTRNLNIPILILVLACTKLLHAQTPGINYQALILNTEELEVPGRNIPQNQVPLASEEVYFRFSITGDPTTDFKQYYLEEQLAVTDENGLVSLIVGEGLPIVSSFDAIVWDGTPKYLNVEIDIVKNGEGFVFLDSQKILYLPQPGTGNTTTVSNGIGKNGTDIVLGGPLTQPTTITVSPTNSLSINGLGMGNPIEDDLLLVNRETGTLKRMETSSLVHAEEKRIIAGNGQIRFSPPWPIGNPDKINVYRNGVRIDFTVIDSSTLELEHGVICYQNDEIRIVQFN